MSFVAVVGALLLPGEIIKEDTITCNNSRRLSSELQVTFCFLNRFRNETSLSQIKIKMS